jgi:FkbM family methyltransferase
MCKDLLRRLPQAPKLRSVIKAWLVGEDGRTSFTKDVPVSAAIAVAKAFGQFHENIGFPDYERLLSRGYRRFLRPGQVVFDIGAHAGVHLEQFLGLVGPSGRVIAFEPIPALAADLATKYRDSSIVEVRNIALGDEPGRSGFLILHKALGMSGFRQRAGSGDQGAEEITVEVDTLDHQAAELGRLDYIKIDIEGAEISCLRGARQTVNRYRPLISVEYGMPGYSMFGNTAMTLFEWARECGYVPSDLFGNLIARPDEWAVVCDYSLWDFFLVPEERRREWVSIF